ncbi:MAG TPA: hypothetical protein VJB15_06405 [Rhodothermia bacterium]|nr:hypothetical protein [Rhodothermia bacterium]
MVRGRAHSRLIARRVQMARDVELSVMGESDGPVAIHEIGHALCEADERPFCAIGADDLLIGVADERIGKVQALSKTVARLLIVRGDANDIEAGRPEPLVFPTEPVGLFRSERGERFREKEDHDVSIAQPLMQRARADSKIRCGVTWFEHDPRSVRSVVEAREKLTPPRLAGEGSG